jgi:hypothetical protein
VVESVEEAILNPLFRADPVVGRDGNTLHGLPVEEVMMLLRKHQPEVIRKGRNGVPAVS